MIDIIIKMIEFMFRYDFLNFLSSELNRNLTRKSPALRKIEKQNEKWKNSVPGRMKAVFLLDPERICHYFKRF